MLAQRSLSAVLVLLLVAAAGSGCGGDGHNDAFGIVGTAVEPNATDAAFARAMLPHQRDALAMAKLARERALRKELRRIARDIAGDRPGEIAALAEVGAQLQRDGVRPGRARMGSPRVDLGDLRDAVSFDQRFMELMIRHLEQAISMAEEEQDRGEHPRLKRLAGEIFESHKRDVEALRRWLRTWYGADGPGPGGGGGGGGGGEAPAPDGDGGEGPGGGEEGGGEGPPV